MFKKNFKPNSMRGSCEQTFLTRVTDGKMVKFVALPEDKAFSDVGSPKDFTLDAQLKAGVVLQEENSVLLQPSESVVNEHLYNFMQDTNENE